MIQIKGVSFLLELVDPSSKQLSDRVQQLHHDMALSEGEGNGDHHQHECCQLIEDGVLIWGWYVVVAEI